MPEIQPIQHQPVIVRCRFAMTAADAHSIPEFCVFGFPGCEGCPKAMHVIKTVQSSEDPMKSMALSGWFAGALPPKKSLCAQSGRSANGSANGEVHSPTKLSPLQETSRGTAYGRAARNAHEVADRGEGERTTARKWISQIALICMKQPPMD